MWNDASHVDDDRMRMKGIVNQLFTFNISIDDPDFGNSVDRWARIAERWDEPQPYWEFLGNSPSKG